MSHQSSTSDDSRSCILERLDSRYYFPQVFWKFFLADIGPRSQKSHRVHVYDVFADTLHETRRIPQIQSIFGDFHAPNLSEECLVSIEHAEESFARLEASAEHILTDLLRKLTLPPGEDHTRRMIPLDAHAEHTLLKYLVFLRFRNSEQYHDTVLNLENKASRGHPWMRLIPRGPLRRHAVLRSMSAFLDHEIDQDGRSSPQAAQADFFEEIEEHCWRPIREGRSELSVGIVSEAQEFISTERCFGNLDEVDPDGSSDGSYHLFFPITPSVAIYLMTKPPQTLARTQVNARQTFARSPTPELNSSTSCKRMREEDNSSPVAPRLKRFQSSPDEIGISSAKRKWNEEDSNGASSSTRPLPPKRSKTDTEAPTVLDLASPHTRVAPRLVSIECDIEAVPDVHIRNTILLGTSPQYILFSSLSSLITAITVSPSEASLSKLKTACREKHIREGLMKTFLIKGEVAVTDLTDEVELHGECAVEHGSFADIWKGEWMERVGVLGRGVKRIIAMKVLRQFMIDNVKEKLLKRLKDEVLTWHRLRHPHIAPLYGIVQLPHHLAMISPWCDNGTVVHYLRDVNPAADRLKLMLQIASGVAYLHNFKPIVIHGDLKGNNILIDDKGDALITDFGVSKVIEDFSSTSSGSTTLAASFFGGATRWMAPELILALVEDEGQTPELTRPSDVYAFASVCLEIMTGKLPYPTRTNAHAVTIDKMRGVKPSSGVKREAGAFGVGNDTIQGEFWGMMDRCWDEWYLRPNMSDLTVFLAGLVKGRGG